MTIELPLKKQMIIDTINSKIKEKIKVADTILRHIKWVSEFSFIFQGKLNLFPL